MKIEIDVEIQDGYDATGEYKKPEAGELYLSPSGKVKLAEYDFEHDSHIILRKKPLTGQAWVDSLPEGTVFLYNCLAHQKCTSGVFCVGNIEELFDDFWSDKRCKITYRPDQESK